MRIYAVITDPNSGRAVLGTIHYPGFTLRQQEQVTKSGGIESKSEPHHPEDAGFNPDGLPILLEVLSGSHMIFVANNGESEASVILKEGEKILFLDFRNELTPSDGRFCYTGHWSQPGDEGVTLLPALVTSPAFTNITADIEKLDFEEL